MIRLRKLGRDERGASVIELALVAPVLASLLIGMVDLSRAYSTKLQLEQAAQRTIEKVMQQYAVADSYATLQAEGASAAGVASSAVTVDSWLECNGARQTSFSGACAPNETIARYVTVDITKVYTPMFRTRFAGADNNGNYTLHGQAGVRVQ